MELSVIQISKPLSDRSAMTVSEGIFGAEFKEALVHQIVTAYQAAGRAGTHAQKTRAEVRGGGKKPWRQKGTGRARAGSSRSPLWRGGGIIFAASPRDYSQKVNTKMYQGALRSIMAQLIREDRLTLIDRSPVSEPKTKLLKEWLSSLELRLTKERILIIVDRPDDCLNLAARNLCYVAVCNVHSVDPVTLVAADKVIVTQAAMTAFEEKLS